MAEEESKEICTKDKGKVHSQGGPGPPSSPSPPWHSLPSGRSPVPSPSSHSSSGGARVTQLHERIFSKLVVEMQVE